MCYTSVRVMKTQNSHFSDLTGTTGTVMIVDMDRKPTSRFYVRNVIKDTQVRRYDSTLGPLLLQSGVHEYMPAAYIDEKVILEFYTIEGYQSCPRSTWNQLMSIGFAKSRFSGACFQGYSSDLERFKTGRLQPYLDSDRDNRSVLSISTVSDDDSEYPINRSRLIIERRVITNRFHP